MPPKINYIIPTQKFELVRNRIGEILIDELDNQLLLSGDYTYDIDVTVEGSNPYIDQVQLPQVNVALIKGKWDNKNQGSADGTYLFAIDAFAQASTSDTEKGDVKATKIVHRILGMVRHILEDSQYKTLGYNPRPTPFIMRTGFKDMDIMEVKKNDANNTVGGRIVFECVLNESVQFKSISLIDGYDTTVKLGSTNEGYFYQGENY